MYLKNDCKHMILFEFFGTINKKKGEELIYVIARDLNHANERLFTVSDPKDFVPIAEPTGKLWPIGGKQ